MRLLYTKPVLNDLSQGSRIAFARQFRQMSQHTVADKLGVQHDNKRRIMTRYEKGERNPKDDRALEISQILNVSYEAIKRYDYRNEIDIFYTLMWLEELIPKFQIDLSKVPNINDENIIKFRKFINEWEIMRNKRLKKEISYGEYIEWKLTYEVSGND